MHHGEKTQPDLKSNEAAQDLLFFLHAVVLAYDYYDDDD